MIVRKAEAADMLAVRELSRALAAHVLDPDPGRDIAALIRDGFGPEPWFECLVAVHELRIVGYTLYSRRYEAHTGEKRLWIGDLFVSEEARRQGVGGALIQAVLARAAAYGCAGVNFELARGNDLAREFYRRLGAQPADDVELLRLPL